MLCPTPPEDTAPDYSRQQRGEDDEWKVPDVLQILQEEFHFENAEVMQSEKTDSLLTSHVANHIPSSDIKLKKPSMAFAAVTTHS